MRDPLVGLSSTPHVDHFSTHNNDYDRDNTLAFIRYFLDFFFSVQLISLNHGIDHNDIPRLLSPGHS